MLVSATRRFAWMVLLWSACLNYTHAEQMQEFGEWQVHYIIIPTTFLDPNIAAQYNIVRGKDRAMINVSVIHAEQGPQAASVTGTYTNLLSQRQDIEFQEVTEGPAVYYLAQLKHTDQDILRFIIQAQVADAAPMEIKFQQKLHADR